MSERETLSAAALYGVDFAREKLSGMRVLALTGAGISTDSGIPDYRGAGRVARHPMTYDAFMGSNEAQIRYWARSFIGWNRIAEALPNRGHFAVAEAEVSNKVFQIITQNVDQLHQKAGAKQVIDLHGRLDMVRCMNCKHLLSRTDMDLRLAELNPTVDRTADRIVAGRGRRGHPDRQLEARATGCLVSREHPRATACPRHLRVRTAAVARARSACRC